jgi:hypothetical protein
MEREHGILALEIWRMLKVFQGRALLAGAWASGVLFDCGLPRSEREVIRALPRGASKEEPFVPQGTGPINAVVGV